VLPKVKKIVDYISSNLDRQLTLDDLAQSAKLSRSRMSYLFRTQTGSAPLQYLKRRRMEKARELLETTSLSVKQIRAKVAIEDRSHFVREFKKTYGVTPLQCRTKERSCERFIPESRTIGHKQ
jgi:AraC family transcriptional regulator